MTKKAQTLDVTISQQAARELYAMAVAPRIAPVSMSEVVKQEILALLKPKEK